jgi:hypothetical protein
MTNRKKRSKRWQDIAQPTGGYRSKFEAKVAENMGFQGVLFEYEGDTFEYTITKKYKCDFKLPNGIFVECKGFFKPEDRTKHLSVRETNPELDIRFLFQSNGKLNKASNMRYSDWCDRHGFKFAVGTEVPEEWLREKPKA